MKGLLFVMIGGGVGAGLRYGVGIASTRIFRDRFPVGHSDLQCGWLARYGLVRRCYGASG